MTRNLHDLFGKGKAVIGMIHLAGKGRREKIDRALDEIALYKDEGLAGAIIEDYHGDMDDLKATLEMINWRSTRIIIGVNALRSTRHTFELAHNYGARFVQVDSVQTRDLDVERYIEFREKYSDIVVLGGVRFKYTRQTGNTLEKDLVEAMPRCDAIVTTGEGTGIETPLEKLQEFRQSLSWLGGFPLISGAGVTADNVREQMKICDAVIVGSYFKNGNTENEVYRENVSKLMNAVRSIQS